MMDFFRQHIGDVSIESLPKPFAAVATDLTTGREIWFRQGPLPEAVRASAALPGVFTPVQPGEQWFVDGGLVNPVPVSLCRAMGGKDRHRGQLKRRPRGQASQPESGQRGSGEPAERGGQSAR